MDPPEIYNLDNSHRTNERDGNLLVEDQDERS